MSRRRREYWAWWHRLRGHHVAKGYGLLTPSRAYRCQECDLTWVRYLI